MIQVCIDGTGRALPARQVTLGDLGPAFGVNARVIAAGPPVESRYFCTDESQIDLACQAATEALGAAGCAAGDVDLIIAGCAVPYQPIPTTAPLILQRLGVTDGAATAFDVNATCLSFVTALQTAAHLLAVGAHRRALIISSEVASRALP